MCLITQESGADDNFAQNAMHFAAVDMCFGVPFTIHGKEQKQSMCITAIVVRMGRKKKGSCGGTQRGS